jgi:FlaA1/EpsC-like NDP-sugar epimerase
MILDDPLFTGKNAERLLGRPLRAIPTEAGRALIRDARILVTGAGGSVGSGLIARLAAEPVGSIIALDHHEASLFRLGRDLPEASLDLVLADVRNQDKVGRILREKRPDLVFHLAAYKHVPLAEYGPDEFVAVNVVATRELAEACAREGVRQFVYPSSDKAVNPPSAYGSTKRLAETLLLALAARAPSMGVHIVRFVNILGSAGSISETLAQRARVDAPVPLTSPEMTRYWMAMDEAVDLLWHSLALPSGSRTVMDVGESVPVVTMAERLFTLVRGEGSRPEFLEIGIRPGERLFEELFSPSESLEMEAGSPVFRVCCETEAEQRKVIETALPELAALLARDDQRALHHRMTEIARELQ